MGREEDAIKDYTEAGKINQQYSEFYHNRGRHIYQYLQGNSLMDLGRIEDAFNDFTIAIEIDPQYSEAFISRGSQYFQIFSIFSRKFVK